MNTLRVIGHVARKEIRQILRDRRSFVLILVMPVILTFLFGKALETGELRDIPSVIVNLDGSPESNLIVTAFGTYDEVRIEREVATHCCATWPSSSRRSRPSTPDSASAPPTCSACCAARARGSF